MRLRYFRTKIDWWLIASAAVLVGMGLLMTISLGSTNANPLFWFWRQALWILMGIVCAYIAFTVDYRVFRNSVFAVLVVWLFANLLLIAVLFAGTRIHGSRSWFELGGFTFQPVELAKVALVLMLAKYFASKNIELWRIRHIAISAIWAFVPTVLVAVQPDLGSALVLAAIWFGMTLVSGIRLRQLMLLIVIFAVLGIIIWETMLSERQRDRVHAIVIPTAVSKAALYNVRQAQIAIGSGGILGKGIGQGTQTQLRFLPAAKTDFVFAAIAEELGFVGAAMVFGGFGILLWRIMRIGIRADNNFARLLAVGFFIMIFVHVFVNIGMNIGIVPVTGIPLPLLSYGGSNVLANLIGLGIVLGVHARSLSMATDRGEDSIS